MVALLGPLLVYGIVFALHLALPGRWVDGYVLDPVTGRPLRYHLNGLRVLFVVLAGYTLVCRPPASWVHRTPEMAAALLSRSRGAAGPADRGFLADLYLGRLANRSGAGGRCPDVLDLVGAGCSSST
jgi:delta14-sterol reductase